MKRIHKATMVLAGALLLGAGLFTACPNNPDPVDPGKGQYPPPVGGDPQDPEDPPVIVDEKDTIYILNAPEGKELLNGPVLGYSWNMGSVAEGDNVAGYKISLSSSPDAWGLGLQIDGIPATTLLKYKYLRFEAKYETSDNSAFDDGYSATEISGQVGSVEKAYELGEATTDGYRNVVVDITKATDNSTIAIYTKAQNVTLYIRNLRFTNIQEYPAITKLVLQAPEKVTGGETIEIKVQDSNGFYVSDAELSISDDGGTGSTITENKFFNAGTTSGQVTVIAKKDNIIGACTITVDARILTNILEKATESGSQVTVTDNEDGSFSFTSLNSTGEWQQQVFFTLDEKCLASIVTGAELKIEMTIETETDATVFLKLQTNNQYDGIDNTESMPTINAGEKKTVSFSGKLASSVAEGQVKLLIDFRYTEAGKAITISDIKIFDLNEE